MCYPTRLSAKLMLRYDEITQEITDMIDLQKHFRSNKQTAKKKKKTSQLQKTNCTFNIFNMELGF